MHVYSILENMIGNSLACFPFPWTSLWHRGPVPEIRTHLFPSNIYTDSAHVSTVGCNIFHLHNHLLESPSRLIIVRMNNSTETANASSYNVTKYVAFPIAWIAIGWQRTLWTRYKGSPDPRIIFCLRPAFPDRLGFYEHLTVHCGLSDSLVWPFH